MSNFDVFAKYYDYFYSSKDYSGEAAHLLSIIQSESPGATDVLNLGCGTGRHDFYLAEKGFHVTGVDASPQMINAARKQLAQKSDIAKSVNFEHCDIREYKPLKKYGAVISMFDVISYVTRTQDILKVFKMVSSFLTNEGVFIFDFWYGPGVLSDRPETRVKELMADNDKLVRIARPTIDFHANKVAINYQLLVLSGNDQGQYDELHTMRYFFLPEMELMMSLAGMDID